MKKSIAVLMLGSALLLPNNNNVEASSFDNKVQVQTVQYVQWGEWGSNQFELFIPTPLVNFNTSKLVQDFKLVKGKFIYYKSAPKKYGFNWDHSNWKKSVDVQKEDVAPAPAKPVEEPAPTPEAKPEPTEPAPAPETKPEPTKPAPSTPEAKPAPTNPAPSTPQPAPTKPVEQTQDASISAIEREVLNLTNAERQKAGLAPLQTDRNLMNSARQKSTDMAMNRYFSHTSPTYGSPFDQMKANGVSYRSAAENIAMGQRTAQEVVRGWMNSPGHRQNILTPSYTHIGIGYDANGHYWTQQFIQK